MHGADRSEQLAAGCRDAAEDRRGSGRATGSFPVRAEQVSESAARTVGGAAQPQERAVVERTTGPVRGGLEGAGYGRRIRRQRGRRGPRWRCRSGEGAEGNAKPETRRAPASGAASEARENCSRLGRGGEALWRLRGGSAVDCRRELRNRP